MSGLNLGVMKIGRKRIKYMSDELNTKVFLVQDSFNGSVKKIKYIYVTCNPGHVKNNTQGVVNILSKFQVTSFYDLRVKVCRRF